MFFSTDTKNGLSSEKYRQAKKLYGKNVIAPNNMSDSRTRGFYGLEKKGVNHRALFTRSIGIFGVIYIFALMLINVLGLGTNLFLSSVYLILIGASLTVFALSEFRYCNLYKISRPKIWVKRNGRKLKVSIESIVPGDIIALMKGDIVPADAKIISSKELSCLHKLNTVDGNKAILLEKTHKIRGALNDMPIANLEPDILYTSDVIKSGYGIAVVFATGADTVIGQAKNTQRNNTSDFTTAKQPIQRGYSANNSSISALQKNSERISKTLFLLSIALLIPAILLGVLPYRDLTLVILTTLTVLAATFTEQMTIFVDFAITFGMNRAAKFGTLIKTTSDIDKLNKTNTLIARKTELCSHEKLRFQRIYFADSEIGYDVSMENQREVSPVLLNAATVCDVKDDAIAKAVFKAAAVLKADWHNIRQFEDTVYKNGIRSAPILTDGLVLSCFGEAENIIGRCTKQLIGNTLEIADIPKLEQQLLVLFDKYDLVMALALKELNPTAETLDTEVSNLYFYTFLCFSEFTKKRSSTVRRDIDSLKNLGVTPVMLAESSGVYTYKTAVNYGIMNEYDDYANSIVSDADIVNIANIDLRKIRVISCTAEENKVRLLRAFRSQNIRASITTGSIKETELLDESNLLFCQGNVKNEVLKNKSAVNMKNISLNAIIEIIRQARLIYTNAINIISFCIGLFIAQYLLIFTATLSRGVYILNPMQIMWSSMGAGFLCTLAIAANDGGDINKLKDHKLAAIPKNENDYFKMIRNRAAIQGITMFIATMVTFLVFFGIESGSITAYIGSRGDHINAQTAAFLCYLAACFISAARYVNIKNKIFIAAAFLNIAAVSVVIAFEPVREYLGGWWI